MVRVGGRWRVAEVRVGGLWRVGMVREEDGREVEGSKYRKKVDV